MQVSSLFFICILLVIGSIGGIAMAASMSTQDPSTSKDSWGGTASPQTVQSATMVKTVATTEGKMNGTFLVFVAAATVLVIGLGAFTVMRKKGYGNSSKYRTG